MRPSTGRAFLCRRTALHSLVSLVQFTRSLLMPASNAHPIASALFLQASTKPPSPNPSTCRRACNHETLILTLTLKLSACRRAALWSFLSAAPQALVALPSYIFVETFSAMLPVALGFAAGCMIWIVFAELMPDALEGIESGQAATAATLSAAW